MEDKQNICDLLCKALQATREYCDLLQIDYYPTTETVLVRFCGGTKPVNVHMDSGSAMIRDIIKTIR